MPVKVERSASFSGHSSIRREEMMLNGFSMFESSGGYGNLFSSSESALGTNEKLTMQNLNNRLASYMEKVRSLEAANMKIELQIKQYNESRSPVHRKDLTGYNITIQELRKQIHNCAMDNARLYLQMDNTGMASSDFKMKYEVEMNLRLAVEADMARLRGTLGELHLAKKDLEIQIPCLQEELAYLKKNHEEELSLLHSQQSGSVDVQVDSGPSMNLDKELQEMREQYELVIQKYRKEAELWFQSKAETLKMQVSSSCTEIKSSQTVLTDLRRTYQSLQIEVDAAVMQKQSLEKNVADIGVRYSAQLSQLQLLINRLQEELQQLNTSMQQQATEYQLLLDIKMRLELEIAEYRRLLEGEGGGSVVTTSSKTSSMTETVTKTVEVEEVVEEYNPLVQRRVKVIVEELVDGKVVATSVDEKIQDVSS